MRGADALCICWHDLGVYIASVIYKPIWQVPWLVVLLASVALAPSALEQARCQS